MVYPKAPCHCITSLMASNDHFEATDLDMAMAMLTSILEAFPWASLS